MATAYQILSAVAAAALLVSCASACGSVPSYNAGSFTDMVPWGCMEPFDCFVEFCTCVDGQMTSTCTPFGAVNATTVERCAARRVTCTLNAALRSHNVWNQSCRGWGENLASLYATYYSDRTFTNLTDACMSDMCALVSAGNSALVEQVNFEHICSFVGFEFPAPLDRDEVAGCAAPARTYFDEIPVTQCNGTTSCYETYCSCVGGAWSASGPQCMMPAAQPPQSLLDSCLSAAVGCLTGAALDIYTPGATALNADPCLEWAVPIAEDFHAYRNASDKSMTALWQACNYTSCKELYRFNSSASFSSVCSFAAVTNRTSNFIPYDPCPFKCPDATCAGNLAGCACTATATIGEISAIFTRQVSANLDMTRTFGGSAFTTYGVANGMNCSDFNFNPLLRFSWTLSNASGVQYTTASSTFSIPSMFMWPGTYSLNVTVTGLVPSQRRARSWQLTVVAPTPVVSITGNGATLRISNQRAISIPAKVTDTFLSVNDFAWSCVAIEGTCPSIENSTATVLFIASNASVGTYVITYTYKSQYTSSVTLTVINGAIPFVRIILPSGALATSPVAAFTYQQSVTLASVVDYSSPFDYNWTINDGALISNRSTVTVAANTLVVTTLADANNGNFQYNTFRIRVYSRENRNIFGEATKTVVVLEDITASLTIAREGSAELVAQGLTDKLVFTYATAPSLTLGTAPFGASLDASIVYFASETATAGLFLATKPSSASLVGTAPLFTDRNVSFKTIRFGVEIRLNGVLTATASATFNITKGDIGAAAASARAALTQIADKGAAVAALSDVNAIIAQTDNATLAAELRTAAFNMIVSNIGNTTVLSASESKAVLSSVAAMLSSTSSSSGGSGSTSEKARTSAKLVGLFTAVLTSDSFDLTVASSVGSAISQMDSTSGGSVAMLTVLKMSSKVSPGEVLSLDLGDIGSVTSTAQTGSALSNLVVADPSGAEVKLPSTFLADLGVDPTAVFGVATAVLKKSPFATGGDPSGGVVSQDITANGESISVSGLSSPIEITLPSGSVGTCQFFQVSTQLWTDDGVVTELTAAGMVCKTSHLTSFGGFDSSAASVALSVLVLVLVALTQVMLA